MTYTELKAKPGEYIWDEKEVQFIGRINKDGTEDKRFSKSGLCSLLNNIIKETGFIPSNPQSYANKIANHKSDKYLVKGYGVIVKCYDLSAEMWVAKAAEHLGIEGNGITDILEQVSKSKVSEHKAKIETLALIFGKELKSKKLADLTEVTDFEKRLKEQRKELSQEKAKKREEAKLKKWIHDAFDNSPLTLVRTALPMFEFKGYRGNNELWILCNVTLRWCLKNRGMKRAVETRYYNEMDKLLKVLKAKDVKEYAFNYAKKNWNKEMYDALIDIEEFHTTQGITVSKEEYQKAKQKIFNH